MMNKYNNLLVWFELPIAYKVQNTHLWNEIESTLYIVRCPVTQQMLHLFLYVKQKREIPHWLGLILNGIIVVEPSTPAGIFSFPSR